MNNKQYDLDTALLLFAGEDMQSAFTIRSACEGVLILGNTGSGKTSGSGEALALKYLKHGFGGLVLTVKQDELQTWKRYCKMAGREKDLIILEPGGEHFFNFLEYESTIQSGTSYAQNILQLLKTVIAASEDRSNGKSDDAFWANALELLLINIINLCLLANGKLTVQMLFDIAQTAPKQTKDGKPDETGAEDAKEERGYKAAMKKAKEKVLAKVEAWKSQHDPLFFQQLSSEKYEELINAAVPELRTLHMVRQFFTDSFYRMAEKTRGIIDFSLAAFLHRLLADPIYTLLCNGTSTFTPESCLDGKIVVINLPVKIYDKVGQDAQTICKFVFQRAWERRDLSKNDRPVFLWADEAQFLLHPHDTIFQTTARSSRIAVVYLSQNLPGFYANMGGEGKKAEHKVNSFLATLSTKIFHANNSVETNQFASALIGEAYSEDVSSTKTVGEGFSISSGSAYSLEKMVRPEAFSKLKTGGPINGFVVEAYIHCQGKLFRSKNNHRKIQFDQNQN